MITCAGTYHQAICHQITAVQSFQLIYCWFTPSVYLLLKLVWPRNVIVCVLARTHTRTLSSRKKTPLDVCIILHHGHRIWRITSLTPCNHCHVEFHCPCLTGEIRWSVQGHISSKLHRQDSNPEIQILYSLDFTTGYCFYTNLSWKWDFFFFKRATSGFASLLPLVSNAASFEAPTSTFMNTNSPIQAPFLPTGRNYNPTVATSQINQTQTHFHLNS